MSKLFSISPLDASFFSDDPHLLRTTSTTNTTTSLTNATPPGAIRWMCWLRVLRVGFAVLLLQFDSLNPGVYVICLVLKSPWYLRGNIDPFGFETWLLFLHVLMFKWQYLCFMELPRTTPLHPMGEGIDTIMEDWNWDRLSNWPMRLSYCIAIGYNFGSWLILPNNRHIRGGHAGRIPLFLTGHKLKYAESRLERPNWYKADMIWNHQRKCKWPNEATLAGLGEFRRFTSRPVAPKPKPVVVSAGAGLGRLQLQIGSDWYQSLLWKNCIFMNNFGYQQVSTLPSKHCLIFNLFGWASC